jgi:5'-3' exonuclease
MSHFEPHDLILDGRHLLWRTSDAFSTLTAKVDGKEQPTGGMYGFLTCCIRVKQTYGGAIRVAWEGRNNFRHKLYPGYKARDRSEVDEEHISEMQEQEDLLGDILEACGVEQIRGERCEADDVIGTLAARNRVDGRNTVVYSGDSDLRQLVRDARDGLGWIKAAQPRKHQDVVYDEAKVLEVDGVRPNQIAHLKAIAGDTSDKIPGAKGLGPKAAIAILEAFGDLPTALEFARVTAAAGDLEGIRATLSGSSKWPGTPRQLSIFRDAADDMEMFLKLTRIRVKVKTIHREGRADRGMLTALLRRYNFRSLVSPLERNTLMGLSVEK